MAEILFPALFILLALGLPVAFAMMIAVFVALTFGSSYPHLVVVKEMFSGLDSFPLLAVPFFILAAEIMTGGAVTMALLRLAQSLVGHLRGGLGHANVVSSAMFAGISGSALADAAGPGSMMIRMMEKGGYDRPYAGALTIASAVVGPIIPPSITMIIYAMQDQQVSVGSLFMAGVLPGVLITFMVLLANAYVSRKRGYVSGDAMPTLLEIGRIFVFALPALSLILLIVGGIRFGVFTPTEASVIAVFYALIVGMFVYRSLKLRDLPGILLKAAMTSGAVLLILGAARAFAWVLIIEGIPQQLAGTIISWELSPIVFLLAVNLLLLAFGLFMDPLPGVMILVPILAPISFALGIDPNHFAIIVIVNLTLGLTTPPVGSLIFVVSSTVHLKPSTLIRELPPFFLALAAALLLITFVPSLSTWLPAVSGF
ncbi:TRAP-type C4-dicarboxylate transport system, large permease component [Tritonibacter mobilis]|jgi:tripartite ATP-independent transporter DctM subunit|uniref:TRAP transporter large permease n=1 Tax=Tritonibacter mobilis TaxID=379347 RepID=UPI0001B8AFAC|nr:TRAP transporter large permease [Tritonibacter mobilis]EEW57736.1 trap dicarboxylate transporter- dctm subunit [Ruegeria sp. TrichCH4B]MBW3245659.1 TRAP transporter large permease [Epibacterium sp. DP7N7-1]MCZ4270304.1 TRAP transporter large permease [Rhodobacteraceae bacterium G21628-S1]MEE2809715.1 TRAP transporter large permease [Pseudomonadota bacterium]NKX39589.1 TRAP transporter large permease [Rhodobacteraceae bacterium R_SAG5]NKX74537.1 TRAP transporter large permease [Rhodobactera